MNARGGLPAAQHEPPMLPRTYVEPARLWRALDDAADCPVIEVVGPAGSGKTLGVAGWLERRAAPAALPARPAEPQRQWWTVAPDLTPHQLRELIRDPARAATDVPGQASVRRVVLDNAERLSPACVRELQVVLDASPEGLRLILLSRWDLPLRRLGPMLLGTMSVVRGDVMRLADDEARRLVLLHARRCRPELVDAIVDQARGWRAAVVLAARAARTLGEGTEVDRAAFGLSASRLVGHEAFASLGPRERHVLLSVCHEDLVTGSTAAHLSQDPDALEIMVELEETGLLVQREPGPGWTGPVEDAFRIHPILVQVARGQLAEGGPEAERAHACVARAALSDVARGDIGTGLRRAYDSAGEQGAVAALARHGVDAVVRGDGPVVDVLVRRCAGAVEAEPQAWVAAAVERWLAGDVETAARWSEQIVTTAGAAPADTAIAHLIRAQLGAEDVAEATLAAMALVHPGVQVDSPRRALLGGLLGAASCWSGDLATAERELAPAVLAVRTQGYRQLTADALSSLGLAELLRGRPAAAADLAAEALCSSPPSRAAGTAPGRGAAHARRPGAEGEPGAMARVVAGAAAARLDPWHHASGPCAEPPAVGRDLVATFVAHATAAQHLVLRGRAAEAELALSVSPPLPALPHHLAVDLRMRRALVAASGDDTDALAEAAAELEEWDAEPERSLVEAFHAICRSDSERARASLRLAAASETNPFVAVTAMVTSAQLAATAGDDRTARTLVAEAVARGEHRRDAVPFLGWVGHLVPLHGLLADLSRRDASPWAAFLARRAGEHGSVAALVSRRTATGREQALVPRAHRPPLTARELAVLAQLARGATYADIAATLFVSPNTVKSHVTSMYAKLGAARRSEALAAARSMHLV